MGRFLLFGEVYQKGGLVLRARCRYEARPRPRPMALLTRLMRLRRWRPGLVTSFGLASIVPVAVIGFVLAHFIQVQVEERALAEATRAATLIGRVGIQSHISPYAMSEGFSAART